MGDTFVPRNSDLSFDPRRSFYAQLHNQLKKPTPHSVSGIQHRPQLSLRNKKDFIRERILYFRPRRKAAYVHKPLIGCVWALHEAGFTGHRGAVRIIGLCRFWRRGRSWRRRRRSRSGLGIFRRRVWIERLLGRWIFRSSRLGRITRRRASRTPHRAFVIPTTGNQECERQCEKKPPFHNLLGRSLHWFYFNASGPGSAIHFAKANLPAISDSTLNNGGWPTHPHRRR